MDQIFDPSSTLMQNPQMFVVLLMIPYLTAGIIVRFFGQSLIGEDRFYQPVLITGLAGVLGFALVAAMDLWRFTLVLGRRGPGTTEINIVGFYMLFFAIAVGYALIVKFRQKN